MPNYTRSLRHQGNLPAEAAEALGCLGDNVAIASLDAVPNVGGGGTTVACGFQLVDGAGRNIERAVRVGFGVYSDANAVTASPNATLATATAGTILSGSGTAELQVLTSATGKFTCTLTDASDETVHLACSQASKGGIPVECSAREATTFSA
jgi:hypothetical protein